MRKLQMDLQDLIKQLTEKYNNRTALTDSITVKLQENKKLSAKEKPTVYFTSKSMLKIEALVSQCDIEIAWHMTVKKEESSNTYRVLDVLMYPQTATAATVEADDDHYPTWLTELSDENHAALRGQGHSHVNMGVNPSSTDTTNQSDMIRHIKDFYLFMIINKRGDIGLYLYDIHNQCVYTNEDINIVIASSEWAADQMKTYLTKKKGQGKTHGPKEIPGLLQPPGLDSADPLDRYRSYREYGSY